MGQDKTNTDYVVADAIGNYGVPAASYIVPLVKNQTNTPTFPSGRLVHGGSVIVKGERYVMPASKWELHKGMFDENTMEPYDPATGPAKVKSADEAQTKQKRR